MDAVHTHTHADGGARRSHGVCKESELGPALRNQQAEFTGPRMEEEKPPSPPQVRREHLTHR